MINWRPIYGKAIAGFIALDVVTYLLLYALILPAFEPIFSALDPLYSEASGHLLTAIRMAFIGAIIVRWIRNKYGLDSREDAIPTIITAAVLAWTLHLVTGILIDFSLGATVWSWEYLVALAEWVGFALMGAIFVSPEKVERRKVTMKYRYQEMSERGSVGVFVIPAVVLLVGAALTMIVIAGSASDDRSQADTAADAAALAAGHEWRDRLEQRFDQVTQSSDPEVFWSLAGTPISGLTPQSAMQNMATHYADRNEAELVGFSISPGSASVKVSVRHKDEVPNTTKRVTSMAESSLRFRSGLCVKSGVLGYIIAGDCLTEPEPQPEPDPSPTEDPGADEHGGDDDGSDDVEPEEPPFEPPAGLSSFKMEVVLTDVG